VEALGAAESAWKKSTSALQSKISELESQEREAKHERTRLRELLVDAEERLGKFHDGIRAL